MTDEIIKEDSTVEINGEQHEVTGVSDVDSMEWKPSAEAVAAADAAIADIEDRSFSGRNPELGKMRNCQFCGLRHRETDSTYREIHDENGKVTVQIMNVRNSACKQTFKQTYVEEDLETGELSIQYATVPLPGQGLPAKKGGSFRNPARPIVGAKYFEKKRKKQRPSNIGNQLVQLTRKIFARINPERFPAEAGRMLEAKRIATNTIRNKRERKAKRIRQEQRRSRRINRG